jgi:hypothetical protein
MTSTTTAASVKRKRMMAEARMYGFTELGVALMEMPRGEYSNHTLPATFVNLAETE